MKPPDEGFTVCKTKVQKDDVAGSCTYDVIRQLQNISEPIAALHLCAVERCMWRFHVVYGCTTEGDLNFEATRVATPSPLVVVNSTGRRLHWRFGGRMFCVVLCHVPFESHQ